MKNVDMHQLGRLMQENGDAPLESFTAKLGGIVSVGILMLDEEREEFLNTLGFDINSGQNPLKEPTKEQFDAIRAMPDWKMAIFAALARIGMAHYSTMVAKEHLKQVSSKN
jgi:hypothetical protein